MKKVTKKIMEKIAEEMAAGKSLVKICKEFPDLPSYRTITRSVQKDEELWEIYRRGRILQAEWYGDHLAELATSPLPDGMDARFMNAEVQRRRLEVDTLKWTLARIQPYGIRDKKEDAGNQGAITLSWANGNVEISDNINKGE
jgi:hypothetical protein|tara:strand:- start:2181 stop:2609 length:429 start_codon:yes stop_codon:yes gene_type:complete